MERTLETFLITIEHLPPPSQLLGKSRRDLPAHRQTPRTYDFLLSWAGHVRQTEEASADEGKTWNSIWDGMYIRKK